MKINFLDSFPKTISGMILLLLVSLHAWSDQKENPSVVLTMLGTSGGPYIDANRSNPATLLQAGESYYLIDSGIGTARRLAEAGVTIDQIKAVFITHQHPDHSMGLADLLADRRHLANNKPSLRPIEIYGPTGTTDFAKAANNYVEAGFSVFTLQGVGKGRTLPTYAAEDVSPGKVYSDESIVIHAHDNTHYVLMEHVKSSHHSLSYRIATEQGSILISGDTGPDEKLAEFGRDTDVFVSEIVHLEKNIEALTAGAGSKAFDLPEHFIQNMIAHMTYQHLPGKEVGLLAKRMNAGTVVLHHFGPADVQPGVMELNISDVQFHFSGQIFAAEDLDRFCLEKNGKGHAEITQCN